MSHTRSCTTATPASLRGPGRRPASVTLRVAVSMLMTRDVRAGADLAARHEQPAAQRECTGAAEPRRQMARERDRAGVKVHSLDGVALAAGLGRLARAQLAADDAKC